MKITFNSTFKSPLLHSKIQLKNYSFIYCTCNPGTKLNAAYITIHNSITALKFHWPRNVHNKTNTECCLQQTNTRLATTSKINVFGSNRCQIFKDTDCVSNFTTFSKVFFFKLSFISFKLSFG